MLRYSLMLVALAGCAKSGDGGPTDPGSVAFRFALADGARAQKTVVYEVHDYTAPAGQGAQATDLSRYEIAGFVRVQEQDGSLLLRERMHRWDSRNVDAGSFLHAYYASLLDSLHGIERITELSSEGEALRWHNPEKLGDKLAKRVSRVRDPAVKTKLAEELTPDGLWPNYKRDLDRRMRMWNGKSFDVGRVYEIPDTYVFPPSGEEGPATFYFEIVGYVGCYAGSRTKDCVQVRGNWKPNEASLGEQTVKWAKQLEDYAVSDRDAQGLDGEAMREAIHGSMLEAKVQIGRTFEWVVQPDGLYVWSETLVEKSAITEPSMQGAQTQWKELRRTTTFDWH